MDIIDRDSLRQLVGVEANHCVSLYMPRHGTVQDAEQDPIRYRNLLHDVRDKLIARGMRRPDAMSYLEPALSVENEPLFWKRNGTAGLAMLLGPDHFHVLHLADRCEELSAVDRRFHLAPLFEVVSRDDHFLLLAVSAKSVRLFRCHSHDISPIELPAAMPRDIDTALAGTEIEKSLQHHAAGPTGRAGHWASIMHGQGAPKDEHKKLLLEFLRMVGQHISHTLRDENAPLVIAAVDYMHPLIRDVVSYQHILKDGIHGSPDSLPENELLARALPVIRPEFEKPVRAASERYQQAISGGRAADSIGAVLAAVEEGRVETLIAAKNDRIWGTFNAETGEVTLRDPATDGDTDLLDLAVCRTMARGGTSLVVDRELVPSGGPVAAILRW